jgi:hypothetical protein
MGLIRKLYNIVIYIRSSGPRTTAFIASAGQQIPLDNRTRWNSWYAMITTASKLEKEVDFFIKNQPDLKKDTLSAQDWEWLRTTEQFLELFKTLTLENEGDQRDISYVLPTLYVLSWHIKATRQKFTKSKVRTIRNL